MKAARHYSSQPERNCNNGAKQDAEIRARIFSLRSDVTLYVRDIPLDMLQGRFYFRYACFHTVKRASSATPRQGAKPEFSAFFYGKPRYR
jgi:hypothetical protein